MATKLGTLTLDLVAKIGNFTEPLNRAEKEAKDTSTEISKSFDAASIAVKAFGAVVAGVSISQIAGFIQQSVTLGNDIKRFSDLSNSSVQEFQYYAAGAETAGISVEKFADQMKDMQDRIGDFAQTGGGPLADFFENIAPKVGVSIKQFQELSGPKALQLYVDSLQKANVDQNDFKFYMEAIISDSSLLLPLLKDGGKGFKEWGDLAQSAGKIMSDDLVNSMVEAKKNIEIMNFQWQGVENRLINNIMPAFNLVVDNMGAISTAAGIVAMAVGVRMALSLAQSTLGFLANAAATKSKVITDYELAKAELAATAAMAKSMGVINAETTALVANARATYQKAAAAREAAIAGSVLATAGRGALAVFGGPLGLGLTVVSVAASYLLMSGNAEETNQKLAEQALVAEKTAKELSKLTGTERKSAIEDLTAAFEAQNKELGKSEKAVASALIDIQNYAKGNVEVTKISNQARLGTISYTEAVERLNALNIPTNLYNSLKKQVVQYDNNVIAAEKSAKALNIFGEEVQLVGNKTQNAVVGIDANTAALNRNATAARGAAITQSQYMSDLQKSVIQTQTINKLIDKGYSADRAKALSEAYFKNGGAITSEDVKLIDLNIAANQKLQANIAKTTEQRKKATDATKAATKAQTDQNRAYQDAVKLAYDYGTEYQRIEHDLTNEIKTIRESALDSGDKTKMIAEAKSISEARKKVYLLEYEQDVDAWNWSEDQKLAKHIAIEKARVIATKGMSKEERQVRLDSFDSQLKQEQAWLELDKQQRLLDARQFYMSDAEYMQERYKLERDEIAKNLKLTQQERDARIAMKLAEEEFEKRKNLKSASIAWGQSYADMTGTGAQFQIEQDRFNRYEESNALFESQIALAETAAEREAIWQAHHERMTAIESAYQQGSYGLQLGYGEQVTGALSNMLGTMLGESSSTYQALFYAQRSFALAQAGMNVWKAASDAYANEPGTVWQKMGAAALATIESGTFVSMIQAATPTGMAHNGIDNIPKEGTWLLDGGERVLNPQQNKDLTSYLQNQESNRGGDVNITVQVTDSGVSTSGGNTQDQKQLGQMIGNAVRTVIRQEQRQGGMLSK